MAKRKDGGLTKATKKTDKNDERKRAMVDCRVETSERLGERKGKERTMIDENDLQQPLLKSRQNARTNTNSGTTNSCQDKNLNFEFLFEVQHYMCGQIES